MPITIRTLSSILKTMAQRVKVQAGTNDLVDGSAIKSILEAAAVSDFKSQNDILNILSTNDLDKATNTDLDNIGNAANAPRPQAKPSNGTIRIYRSNFNKISSKIYQGQAAPPAGTTVINVADASQFPPTGALYLSRNTDNLEGPLAYTSITLAGSYYQIQLASPTTKNHNTGESVILSQGGTRTIPSGTVVQTSSTDTTPVQFRLINSVNILDGEIEINDVSVVCLTFGSIGNVSPQSIVEFTAEPFPGAKCENPLGFVNGRDAMSDPDYRDYIRKIEKTRVRCTDLAVKQAAINVSSTDDNKTVTSSEIRKPANTQEPSTLFIDDSTGYNPIFSGQGFEQVIDNANGGEKYLQLQNQDLTKAILVSSLQAPFAVTSGMSLSFKVGGSVYTHTFAVGDFATEGAADVFEIINSINANPNIAFSARAFNNNKQISVFAKDFKNEDIESWVPTLLDANDFIKFPEQLQYTLRLYKNEVLLVKDGYIPTIRSEIQSLWLPLFNGETLSVKVDGIAQSITINDSDFIQYGFLTVNKDNSLESWANVLNDKIAGLTAIAESNVLKLVSNKGANNKASLEITGGTLISNNVFALEFQQGVSKDYDLNRSTGQIQLTEELKSGDVITAGSKNTQGFIESNKFPTGYVTLATSPLSELYLAIDSSVTQRQMPFESGSIITVTHSGNTTRYTANSAIFTNAVVNDWLIVVNNGLFSANNVGAWRINAKNVGNTWVEVLKTNGTNEVINLVSDDIFVAFSDKTPQRIVLNSGTNLLSDTSNAINNQLIGGYAEVFNGTKIRISTNSFELNYGNIALVGQNLSAITLGYSVTNSQSKVSHTAFNTSKSNLNMIDFKHDYFAFVSPLTASTSISSDKNGEIGFLNPYGTNKSSNEGVVSDIASYSGNIYTLRSNPLQKDIFVNDRFYSIQPLNLKYSDSLAVILDNSPATKTFDIRVSRKGIIYSSASSTQFNSYDLDLSGSGNWPNSFGDNFDFKDFKMQLQARYIIDPTGINNKILIRNNEFGVVGNNTQFGLTYPTLPGQDFSSMVNITANTNILVSFPSGALRVGGTWDNTTYFDVTNPIGNTWRYTYNTVGTAPQFNLAGIQTGDIVNISSNSTFNALNQGSFKVTAITATYFEITNYFGVAETNKNFTSSADLKFFPLDTFDAAGLVTWINGNLTNYISAENLDIGSGSILNSTLDETSGSQSYYQLVDGEAQILSSNIGTNSIPVNLFTLKSPLSISGADLLNEEFYLVPTKTEQVSRMFNRFAVTGLASQGSVTMADSNQVVQISSDLFGSSGVVQVTGGNANQSVAALTSSVQQVDLTHSSFTIAKSASSGLQPGQWVKVANTTKLNKNLQFDNTTQLQLIANFGLSESTINITAGAGSFRTQRVHSGTNTTQIRVEKQGKFVCLSWTGIGTNPNFVNLRKTDKVVLSGIFSGGNSGTYNICSVFNNSFYIENENFVEGDYILSNNADISVFSINSVMVGDTFSIGSSVLDGVNESHIGSFAVKYVNSSTQIVITTSFSVNAGPALLGNSYSAFTCKDQSLLTGYAKISNIAISSYNPNLSNVVIEGIDFIGLLSNNSGSNITTESKLGFTTSAESGVDSYKYYGGLISAVGQVLRGKASDPISFPGWAAAGSSIEVDAALTKRIQLSIVIRNRTGTPFSIVRTKVQAAVQAYVNSLGVGEPVVFSQIILAAQNIDGVQAVSISSPLYDSSNDQIQSQPNQKPRIIDINADVVVSLAN